MRAKWLRVFFVILVASAIAQIVGRILSKRMTKGDETSDEFQVAAIMGGKEFRSRASNLRSGVAIASMGGVDLDLRDAKLDPAGADLELRATMGGARIVVPDEWAVDVDQEGPAGRVEVNVTPLEDLPEDAPKLHVHAVSRMGGGEVTTGPA